MNSRIDMDRRRYSTSRKNSLIDPGRVLFLTVCVVCAGLVAGCGYRLGTSLPPGIRTVHIKPFANQSEEPDVENATTRAAISEFIRDGTLEVVDASNADVLLQGAITKYNLIPLDYDENTSATPEEYRLVLTAHIKLVHRLTEAVLLNTTTKGNADFSIRGDLTSAKREALPDATEDLARHIVDAVVEYW